MRKKEISRTLPFIKSINPLKQVQVEFVVKTETVQEESGSILASLLPELESIICRVEGQEDEIPGKDTPLDTDGSRYELWMVADWGVEYRDLVERMRMAETIADTKERNKKYSDIIVKATKPINRLFEEEEVIGMAEELRKPEYNHCLEEYLPYLSVVKPQDTYRQKVLLLKAMILNLVVTLVQRIACIPHYSETNAKGL